MSPRHGIFMFVAACGGSPGSTPGVDAPAEPHVATGEVGTWQAAPALPIARANHCAAVIDDWLLVIGGNRALPGGGFAKTDEIHAARLAADGTLGAWQLAGYTASAVSEC